MAVLGAANVFDKPAQLFAESNQNLVLIVDRFCAAALALGPWQVSSRTTISAENSRD